MKLNVQNQLRSRLGLIVDKTRGGESRTSDKGNTPRKIYLNSVISAEITDLNRVLVTSCSTI